MAIYSVTNHLFRSLVAAGLGAVLSASAADTTNRVSFGFTGPEIFPIDYLISQIRVADINGDKLMDLVVANNSRSKITLLINQTGREKPAKPEPRTGRTDVNELPPDARFRIDTIASEKRIAALEVVDLNSDGRPDIAYFGDPKELVVQYNLGAKGWSAVKRWTIDDGQMSPNALVSGDLNGDERIDLVLLGESSAYLLAQDANQSLGEPEKIPFSGTVKSIQVLDIDGDGRDDLLLSNWDTPNPFRFRLQNDAGQLGPEIHFELPPVRSYWADDLDGDRRTEIITIAQNSGRAQVSGFNLKPSEPLLGSLRQGQFQVLPFNKTTKARRGVAWADVTGDKRPDLIVAEPESGQLTLYEQKPDGSLAAGRTFPTLTGVTDLAVADWDADGRPEIFLLSSDERQIGMTRLDANGRIGFPELIATDGKPLSLAVGPLFSGEKPSLVTIVDQDGKRSLVIRGADGKTRTRKLSENFKSNPSGLVIHDANHDDRMDLVLLIPYEKLKILVQKAEGEFDEVDVAPPGGNADQPWCSRADVDGDGRIELLLAQKNFIRAVVLKPEAGGGNDKAPSWVFQVKEQINGAAGNSRITGATAVPNGTNRVATLFLLDAERKAVTLCERDAAGVWQVRRNLSLPITDFSELQPVLLGETGQPSVAFFGLNAVAWLPLQGQIWQLNELDGYETPIKGARLTDVVTGDLNQDGKKDLVFLEMAKNHVDLVVFEPPGRLVPANRWQVFEERTFRSRRSDAPEPREALVADFTGDGKNDLVVLVHDRILLYPQE